MRMSEAGRRVTESTSSRLHSCVENKKEEKRKIYKLVILSLAFALSIHNKQQLVFVCILFSSRFTCYKYIIRVGDMEVSSKTVVDVLQKVSNLKVRTSM